MEDTIQPADLPFSVVEDKENEWMPFVVIDVHGEERGRYVSKEDAELYVNAANAGLSKEPARDTGAKPAQSELVKQKEKTMPRGIPKKKSKKRAVTPAVKKTAKKTMGKVAKKKKKKKRVIY